MFTSEDEPEAEEDDVEEALSDIGKEGVEEREVEGERESFKRQVELRERECKKSECFLQKIQRPIELVESIQEPDESGECDEEEDEFEEEPDFGESTIGMDGDQVEISQNAMM